jgi:hypothetical protein
MSVLEVNELRVRYNAGSPEILKGISFEVEENDFCYHRPQWGWKIDLDSLYKQVGRTKFWKNLF